MGAQVASRVTPRTVMPIGAAAPAGRRSSAACARIGMSLAQLAEQLGRRNRPSPSGVALVDRDGGSLGGDPRATRRCRSPPGWPRRSSASRRRSATTARTARSTNSTVAACRQVASSSSRRPMSATAASSALLLDIWGGFGAVVLALRWCRCWRSGWAPIAGACGRCATSRTSPVGSPAARTSSSRRQRAWGARTGVGGRGRQARWRRRSPAARRSCKAGLEQRDHMLREIHHRVKNNLQMISSLLNLQAGEIRSPRIRRFFGDAQNRVLTLSILHRHLYERSSWSLVDFQQFISDLVRQISVARPRPRAADSRATRSARRSWRSAPTSPFRSA